MAESKEIQDLLSAPEYADADRAAQVMQERKKPAQNNDNPIFCILYTVFCIDPLTELIPIQINAPSPH